MRKSVSVATVTVFTSLIVASDFALAGVPNVKLVDTLVFLAAYLFGLPVGASVGILSEFIWAYTSPWGLPGSIAPFLIFGELIYAGAGSLAAKLWRAEPMVGSVKSIFLGAMLSVCAFLWDLETNLGTAIIAFWPSLTTANVIGTILVGIPFMLSHELSDFLFGALLVPAVVLLMPKLARTELFGPRTTLTKDAP